MSQILLCLLFHIVIPLEAWLTSSLAVHLLKSINKKNYFFSVNTKYISSRELETSKFSFVLRTHENSDVFKTLDEIYLLRIHLKKLNILYVLAYSVQIRSFENRYSLF